MTDDAPGRPALGRRRPRLSHDETERRMLAAAVDLVNRDGLTVSLDHISLEEVIREAGVARSAAYRRWPYKDLFLSDLLRELAAAATPAAVAVPASVRAVAAVLRARLDWLDTPRHRHELVVELIRAGAEHDFGLMYESVEWRTYLALHATFLSLDDGNLRSAVGQALAEADRGFTERIARSWRHVADLLGYRPRPGLRVGFEALAQLAAAHVRGLVIMALPDPELARARFRLSPFGATEVADWSLAGLAMGSVAHTFLEPDPDVDWTPERIGAIRALLAADDWIGAATAGSP